MDITSISTLYTPKHDFPYLVRTTSSDYYQVITLLCFIICWFISQSATIILLLQNLNITNVAYCYTPDA